MLPGIDVSHWEGKIDWQSVKTAGYRYAFTKATEGCTYLDDTFYANVAGAHAAGIPIGAFHFFHAAMPVQKQADLFIKSISSVKLDLPPVLDFEENPAMSKPNVAAAIKAWLDAVETATGRKPIIYTGMYYWNDYVGNPGWAKDYPLWIAQYATDQPRLPQSWPSWMFWQYTDKGTVPGIQGGVDLDYAALSETELLELANLPVEHHDEEVTDQTLPERIAELEQEISALMDLLKTKALI
jgi:lysozyme